ncbi:MAG: hypothetical protein ACI9SQ_002018 [Rubritalea sp.]|jgi:hypothetical protein
MPKIKPKIQTNKVSQSKARTRWHVEKALASIQPKYLAKINL